MLQGLEERFLGLIEPKLAAALSQKNGERVQQLSGMLLGIQCYGTVEKLYNTARMAPLQVTLQAAPLCMKRSSHRFCCACHVAGMLILEHSSFQSCS